MTNSTPIKRYRIGIDTGGTFTDVVLVDEATGEILVAKVPTVPADPSEGCISGINKALSTYDIDPTAIGFTVHGTTIATNMIIEGKGAKSGLITCEGFRDVLEIAYQTRPKLFDIFYDKPKPLIPRYLCLGVPQRNGPDGEVVVPLDETAVRQVAKTFRNEAVESIAVALLHSYKNPDAERQIRNILAEECPDLPVVLSSDISPEYREYPRTSTTVVNTVLLPRVGPYIARLEEKLQELGIKSDLYLMSSSGGIIAANIAKLQPVQMVESGPAAGVIGAAFVAGLSGHRNLLALDIGGTTAKLAVVNDGEPQIAEQFEVGSSAVANVTAQRGQGYPVLTPVISLVEIGAGGGSIAYLDDGGLIRSGPQSSGAVPGPACYGRNGKHPTTTDAAFFLGMLGEGKLASGLQLNKSLAEEALNSVGGKINLSAYETAKGILKISSANMADAIREITIEQGIDPRELKLLAFGGAGPLMSNLISQELDIKEIIVPPYAGNFSAWGLLGADLLQMNARTKILRLSDEAIKECNVILDELFRELQKRQKISGPQCLSGTGMLRNLGLDIINE